MSDAAAAFAVLASLRRPGDPAWRLVARLDGGRQSGAWRVGREDGLQGVLKVTTSPTWAARLVPAARAVTRVRSAGYPTPAWLESGSTQDGVGFVVQEHCDGHPPDVVDAVTAEALLDVIASQAELDPDPLRCWSDFVADHVGGEFAGLLAAAAAAGADGRLLDGCERLARSAPIDPARWPRTDMVHGDFRPANVLVDDTDDRPVVRGVVDIEAIGSGTRAFDHATLLSHGDVTPGAVERIVRAGVDTADATVLRACVAAVFLDLVRFSAARSDVSSPEQRALVTVLGDRAAAIERLTG